MYNSFHPFVSLLVIGALIGQHKGRHLEIMNSFELVFSQIEGLTVIDKDYYKTKEEQCEFLGLFFFPVVLYGFPVSWVRVYFKCYLNVLLDWLVKQVFQDMDFLGWYTTGDMPTPMDIHIQRQICEINESPVLLKLNPLVRNAEVSFLFGSWRVYKLKQNFPMSQFLTFSSQWLFLSLWLICSMEWRQCSSSNCPIL